MIRFAVLGAGFMGKIHAGNIVGNEGSELVAVCDIDREAAASLSDQCGGVRVFDSFDTMMSDGGFDALCVCLPPFAHDGEVEQAAAEGVHIFIEKPIALDTKTALAMVEAVEEAGVVSQVGFHFRFRKGVRRLKAMIGDGSAGKSVLFDARYWCDMEGSPWWRLREKSGGQIIEQVIHLYDLAGHLFGRPRSVSGRLNTICRAGREDCTIEDVSVGQIEFESGALASITGCNCALPLHFIGDWRVVCQKVMFETRSTGQHWVTPDTTSIYYKDGERLETESIVEDADPYALEMDAFIDAVGRGQDSPVPIREGLESLRTAELVVRSSAEGGRPIGL